MSRQPRYSRRYTEAAREAILNWQKRGDMPDGALARELGITRTVLRAWCSQHAEFSEAIADARSTLALQQAQTPPARAGRPSKYTPDMDETARLHAATGKNDEAIARELGISMTTLRNWRTEHVSLHEAIQNGRDYWAVTVSEESLLKRVQGYEYEEITVEESDRGERTIRHTRHMPPDTKAAQFLLTNRAPERWSNKEHIEADVKQEVKVVLIGGRKRSQEAQRSDT